VDVRLQPIWRRRRHRLRVPDLPEAARAITAYQKNEATLDTRAGRPPYVRLSGVNFDVVFMKEDWVQILPFLQTGFFNLGLFPVARFGFQSPIKVNNTAVLAQTQLYDRVFAVLQQLFTEDFPTSPI